MSFPLRAFRRFLVRAIILVSFLVSIYIATRFYFAWTKEGSKGVLLSQARPTAEDGKKQTFSQHVSDDIKDTEVALKTQDSSNNNNLKNDPDTEVEQDEKLSLVEKKKVPVTLQIAKASEAQPTYPDPTEELPCPNVHIFYYPWYNNPKVDQHYAHWNHEILPHWDKNIDKIYEKKPHIPPNDVGSNFYPKIGAYSSRDPEVIREHLEQISNAGVGVIVVSYYPLGQADDSGKPWDDIYLMLLDQAAGFNIKVTFHIEPYKNRNEKTVRDDIVHIIDTYGNHQGFYKHKNKDNAYIPLIYVYDSYHTKPEDWARLLSPEGVNTIRGTKYDTIMIALAVEFIHTRYITVGGFNGIYTYFATNGFTFGSTWQNWDELSKSSKQSNSLFIPSVGPGYIDTSIRPWNAENTRDRVGGEYYKNSWKFALNAKPEIISITSFNEWHEGTQIEKAIPKITNSRTYLDYKPFPPDRYLKLTKSFVDKFSKCK